jgi:hypothetical protein
VNIPDYISPIVGYRVWHWDSAGLRSLNDEPWLPDRPLAARCGAAAAGGTIVGRAGVAHDAHEAPQTSCSCGIYASKNREHLRRTGYERFGICGDVYLWGSIVEHELGWRAQFAYPKSLVLPPDMIPFKMGEVESRLETLVAYDCAILVGNERNIPLWAKGSGYSPAGLDYLIEMRKQYYVRHQLERALRKGDRVAILGHGLAVVEQADENEARVVLWNRLVLRIARKDIALNQRNMRWECEAKNA